MLELYSDYLLSSFGATTATGLSSTVEGAVSHDQVTRFLSREDYDSKTLWEQVKPMVRAIEQPDGVLIFDDTTQEKPYTDENELISWHFDHSKNRSVKELTCSTACITLGAQRFPWPTNSSENRWCTAMRRPAGTSVRAKSPRMNLCAGC